MRLVLASWLWVSLGVGSSESDTATRPSLQDQYLEAGRSGDLEQIHAADGQLCLQPRDNRALINACIGGHLPVVRHLLEDVGLDPAACKNAAFKAACRFGNLEVAKELYQTDQIDVHKDQDWAFRRACHYGQTAVAVWLLEVGARPAARHNSAIRHAAQNGHYDTVRLLLGQAGVKPQAAGNWALRAAAQNGHCAVVKLLLGSPLVDPMDIGQLSMLIQGLVVNDHADVLEVLFSDQRVQRQCYDPYLIRYAAYMGYDNTVKVLLAAMRKVEPRLSPLSTAAVAGRASTVRLLLTHPLINPGHCDNYALRHAALEGHVAVVRILLADRRIAPTLAFNKVIRKTLHRGFHEVYTLLTRDQRTAFYWNAEAQATLSARFRASFAKLGWRLPKTDSSTDGSSESKPDPLQDLCSSSDSSNLDYERV